MQSVAELIELLLIFETIGSPVISLYLNAQADQHGQDNFHTFVRNGLRERARTFQPGSPERESFDKDVERIIIYLEDEVGPSANGRSATAY